MILDSVLKEVIKDYIEKELPEVVEREIKVPLEIPIKRAISLIGPRRAGKTYFMFQLMKSVDPSLRLYLNFEDYRLTGITSKEFFRLIEIYYSLFPENKKRKVYFFFDEIQNVSEWEKVVRHLLDNENCQIFITGSSSKLLSKEIATQLRGRSLTYFVFPFSFREFLKAKNINFGEVFSSYERFKMIKSLEDYLKIGGYPEIVIFNNKEKIINEVWEVTISRDIIERWKVKNIKALRLLIRAIKESSKFSVHKYYNFLKSLGIKISKNTLYSYLEYLKDSLILFSLHKFSPSYKNVEKSIPKIYLVDVGLYESNTEISRLMENVVFIELKRRNFENIFYYTTKKDEEIDFLAIKNGRKFLIEVTYDLDEDHRNKVLNAMNELQIKEATIITWDYEDIIKHNNLEIKCIPLWKWLLNVN